MNLVANYLSDVCAKTTTILSSRFEILCTKNDLLTATTFK